MRDYTDFATGQRTNVTMIFCIKKLARLNSVSVSVALTVTVEFTEHYTQFVIANEGFGV
jgi:hypothetical protein